MPFQIKKQSQRSEKGKRVCVRVCVCVLSAAFEKTQEYLQVSTYSFLPQLTHRYHLLLYFPVQCFLGSWLAGNFSESNSKSQTCGAPLGE